MTRSSLLSMRLALACAVSLSSCDSSSSSDASEDAGSPDFGDHDISWNRSIAYGTLKDSRDGQVYRTVRIGAQTWMAENLNYAGSGTTGSCYKGSSDSCAKYGRLYTWVEMMVGASASSANPSGVQGICPDGWHIPSDPEWSALVTAVGGGDTVGAILKSSSGWSNSGNGRDTYGFRALPAGLLGGGFSADAGSYAYFWSTTQKYTLPVFWYFWSGYDSIIDDYSGRAHGYSVRCVKE